SDARPVSRHLPTPAPPPVRRFSFAALPGLHRALVKRPRNPVQTPTRVCLGEDVLDEGCAVGDELELLLSGVPPQPCRSMFVRLVYRRAFREALSLALMEL